MLHHSVFLKTQITRSPLILTLQPTTTTLDLFATMCIQQSYLLSPKLVLCPLHLKRHFGVCQAIIFSNLLLIHLNGEINDKSISVLLFL